MNIPKKTGGFGRAFVPFIAVIALNIAITLLTVFLSTGSLDSILGDSSLDVTVSLEASLLFSIVGLVIFSLWYRRKYIRPNRYQYDDVERGFSLPLILALVILAVAMQFICQYILNGLESVMSSQVNTYLQSMDSLNIWSLGFSTSGIILFAYAIVLGPVMEETVFRGLIMGSCLESGGFWAANILQAVLFGIYHMNLVQGIYAFAMGLFLGYVAYRGKGIRYSITLHIVFNVIGLFWSSIVTNAVTLFSRGCLIVAVILAAFALYVYTDEFHIPKAYRNKTAARSIPDSSRRFRNKKGRHDFYDTYDDHYDPYDDGGYDHYDRYDDYKRSSDTVNGREPEDPAGAGDDYGRDSYASGRNRRYDYGDDDYDSRF